MSRNKCGVLVRLTTCTRLNQLPMPKLSLIKRSPPLKRRDSGSAGYTGGRVKYPSDFIFLLIGIPGRRGFFKLNIGEKVLKSLSFIGVDGGIRTHDPPPPTPLEKKKKKTLSCRRRHLLRNQWGLLVRLTTSCKKV